MRTTVEELRTLYVKMGGKLADVKELQTDAELIDKIEDIAPSANPKVIVLPEEQTATMYGETVSNMQAADFQVVGNAMVGNVKKLTSGELPSYWGAGNFMAVKFIILDPDVEPTDIQVGINNLVTLDNDLNGAIKIEDKTKPFRVVVDVDGQEYKYNYNLNGLKLAE